MPLKLKPLLASFWWKVALTALLIALADWLFVWRFPGSTVGLFALGVIVALAVARPGLWRDRRALAAMAAAILFATVMADRPGFLLWLLFGIAIGVAALSARARSGEPVWRWGQRLIVAACVGLIRPLLDLLRLSKARRRRGGMTGAALAGRLALPVVGGLIFLGLFAAANPVIGEMLGWVTAPSLGEFGILRLFVWGVVGLMAWMVLRPTARRKLIDLPTRGAVKPMREALSTSILWSLVVFNGVFALQNGMDIAFLWSGAPPPGDVTLADYAHKGTFLLILTALMAGGFVLTALRPGSDLARRPAARVLVMLWIAQTLVLVTSCLIRMADYIEAYSLTRVRILALVLMALVGVWLILIGWRMLKTRSTDWFVDANAAAVLATLAAISVVDLGAVAAAWNVRHAREVGGRGVELDVDYLRGLGAQALVSLVELELSTDNPRLRNRVGLARQSIMADMHEWQREWRGWTWRDQRRLDRVVALTRGRDLPIPQYERLDEPPSGEPALPSQPAAPTTTAPAPLPDTSSPVGPTPLTANEGH